VLLRLREKGDGFVVVGECYVEGLVCGEALEWVDGDGGALLRLEDKKNIKIVECSILAIQAKRNYQSL
jgi:hypothetical protein